MKKQILSLLALVAVMSLSAKTIYLNTGGGSLWETDGANKFAVWHWQGAGNGTWSAWMTRVAGSVWQVDIADSSDRVIFCRFNNAAAAPDWGADMWNQTDDQTPGDNDLFRITAWKAEECQENCKSIGVWSKYVPIENQKYYIAGNGVAGNPWCCGQDWKPAACVLDSASKSISFLSVPAGSYQFKITDGTWASSWGASDVDAEASTKGWGATSNGDVSFKTTIASDITVAFNPTTARITLTVSSELAPIYTSAVPLQCPDVLLQGFYYDSYEVDSAHAGTSDYGDTKWKTLLKQAGEIGAYFDLIWLPPSGYASGVGYHPKQYSNQNSDWGSRAELEALIAAFHNSGTKVVADIVANHTEAMASWCDFAVQNFGEYGIFQPDGSYICEDDEMNWPQMKADTLAGPCWKTATGPKDDGANWDAARDWAHSNVQVQALFKAYLKWMRNVMKYDGWRYDKGDGFNNWHMHNYNTASEPYIAFEERYDGNVENLKAGIRDAEMDMMALDFALKFDGIKGFESWNYVGRKGLIAPDGTGSDYWKRHAVTWVDNHDMFMREDNELEFCGRGKSMTPECKARLLGANAFILSMPGIPCVFYPHWYKYKAEIKDMINARHLAGVHSESEVSDEYWDMDGNRCAGYQATVKGKNGWLILCLGTKANKQGFGPDYKLMASLYSTFNDNGKLINESYEIWVNSNADMAPGIIATPDASFEDQEQGITVTVTAVSGSCDQPVIYYTTDGSNPTTASDVYTGPLNFKQTTTLKVMGVCGTAQSKVQTYTYTYREPLTRGIRVRFNKPAQWDKVYFFAWIPGEDEQGNPTAENIMGAFPGQRIYQDIDGWYTYEFDQSLDSVNFCISSGVDCGGLNIRSNDLMVDYDADFGWEEGFETESKYEHKYLEPVILTPKFDLSLSPEEGVFRSQTEGQRVFINAVGRHGTSIYYTTDGSDPATCANPAVDSVSFMIYQTTKVRAYAFDATANEQTPEYSATYTYKAPQQGAIKVRFAKPEEWTDLYLYAFTRVKVGSKFKDTPYSLDGKSPKWPGMKWTTTEEENGVLWHTWTMKPEVKEIYVIFTEGKDKPQTQDIYLAENTCYIWREECKKAVVSPFCDGTNDLEEIITISHENNETYKIIVDDRLVIIRDGVMYDVLGRRL